MFNNLITRFAVFVLLVSGVGVKAQFPCVDAGRVNPGYLCPNPEYKPVCGCDGNTYRNICEAQNKFGVNYWSDGPCSGFEFDIIPTFLDDNSILQVAFVQNAGITAQFVLIDFWGKVILQRTLPAMVNFNIPFRFELPEAGILRPGTYIILVYNANGAYRYKKFVKA